MPIQQIQHGQLKLSFLTQANGSEFDVYDNVFLDDPSAARVVNNDIAGAHIFALVGASNQFGNNDNPLKKHIGKLQRRDTDLGKKMSEPFVSFKLSSLSTSGVTAVKRSLLDDVFVASVADEKKGEEFGRNLYRNLVSKGIRKLVIPKEFTTGPISSRANGGVQQTFIDDLIRGLIIAASQSGANSDIEIVFADRRFVAANVQQAIVTNPIVGAGASVAPIHSVPAAVPSFGGAPSMNVSGVPLPPPAPSLPPASLAPALNPSAPVSRAVGRLGSNRIAAIAANLFGGVNGASAAPPPPVSAVGSARVSVPAPPPISVVGSARVSVPAPPPISVAGSIGISAPPPPPLSAVGSARVSAAPPPPVSVAGSVRASVVPPPQPSIPGSIGASVAPPQPSAPAIGVVSAKKRLYEKGPEDFKKMAIHQPKVKLNDPSISVQGNEVTITAKDSQNKEHKYKVVVDGNSAVYLKDKTDRHGNQRRELEIDYQKFDQLMSNPGTKPQAVEAVNFMSLLKLARSGGFRGL
jgi:hypothetical protein